MVGAAVLTLAWFGAYGLLHRRCSSPLIGGFVLAWFGTDVLCELLGRLALLGPALPGLMLAFALPGLPAALSRTLAAARRRPSSKLRRLTLFALTLGATALATLLVEALLLPPRGWDTLTYHLGRALLWAQEGGLVPLPPALVASNAGFTFPRAAEFLYSVHFAAGGSYASASAVALVPLVALLAATRALARELLGGLGALAAALVLLTPVVLAQAATSYVDIPGAAAMTAAVAFTLAAARRGRSADVALAFAALALAVGTKYNLALFSLPFLVALAVVALRRRRARSLVWALLLLPALVPYVENALRFGNPLYDLALFGLPGKLSVPLATAEGLLATLLIPLTDPGLLTYEGGFGGLFWLVGLPACAVLAWRNRRSARALVYLAPFLYLLAFVAKPAHIKPDNLRVVLPALPVAAVACAWALARSRFVLPTFAAAFMVLSLTSQTYLLEHRALVAGVSRLVTGEPRSRLALYDYQFRDADDWALADGEGTALCVRDTLSLIAPWFGSRAQNRVYLRR